MVRIMGNTNAAEHYHSYRTPRPPAPHLSVVEPPRSPARITPTTRGTTDAGTTPHPSGRGRRSTFTPRYLHGRARNRYTLVRHESGKREFDNEHDRRECAITRGVFRTTTHPVRRPPGPRTSRALPGPLCG